nr:hypothetical protein [Elizabethkingia sp. ASV34]
MNSTEIPSVFGGPKRTNSNTFFTEMDKIVRLYLLRKGFMSHLYDKLKISVVEAMIKSVEENLKIKIGKSPWEGGGEICALLSTTRQAY